jgi:hypothetical protein
VTRTQPIHERQEFLWRKHFDGSFDFFDSAHEINDASMAPRWQEVASKGPRFEQRGDRI